MASPLQVFSTYSNEDYDRRNEDVDPMAASAEYELEKRVERLELFPVELEKGELESLGPLPGRGGSFCPGPLGVCTGMFLLPGSRPLSASHSHTDPAQPRLPPPPPLSCALPCARALPCVLLRLSVPGGACGLGPQARGALRRCSLSCDLKRSREMQGRGETWWIQVAGEEGCASKASFFLRWTGSLSRHGPGVLKRPHQAVL